jgi:predicted N-acyltransferase
VAAAHGRTGAAWRRRGKTTAQSSRSPAPCTSATATRLYGRYWGCIREYDCLHFEACYYQGIDYCIREGLKRFDPGAQGEHKIQRGFEPTTTVSSHWIARPELDAAVGNFAREEQGHIAAYREEAKALLPFKQPEG